MSNSILDYSNEGSPEQYGINKTLVRTVKDLPTEDQPRERAKNFGIASLSNADLFAIILRTGTKGYPVTTLCRDLMRINDNLLLNLERKTEEEIRLIPGIGELKAMQISAVMEIVRRYSKEKVGKRPQINSSLSVYELMKPEIGNLPHEEIWVLFMNRANEVIGKYKASEGGSSASVFDIKKILRNAIIARADGLIMCHNHPSGALRPSPQDSAITRKCMEACRMMDINLVDHVIVTTDGYYSFRDSGNI